MMLVANDDGIAQFLGDAETMFHDDWIERTPGLNQKYENVRTTLTFVKKAPLMLVDALEGLGQEVKGLELFREYFSLPKELEGRGPVTPPKPIIKVKPNIRLLKLEDIKAGFVLRLTPEGKERLPLTVSVRAAYATLKGSSIVNYRQTDFDVEKTLKIRSRGCHIRRMKGNLIELEITDPEFALEVSGFDINRDLEVRLRVHSYGK